ncbi:unnamed protein product [Protopolystoma xenopodis]|uniref:Uncharacterized protein n=1 Tax=Protopolystoma xenopodis TaxID=117903 RepID=A0A3S5C1V7_9PLAT|nr:unnamed protein product [Protopolystoma xenopodis]
MASIFSCFSRPVNSKISFNGQPLVTPTSTRISSRLAKFVSTLSSSSPAPPSSHSSDSPSHVPCLSIAPIIAPTSLNNHGIARVRLSDEPRHPYPHRSDRFSLSHLFKRRKAPILKPGYFSIELNQATWIIPTRYTNLQVAGHGAYGLVW